MTNIADPDQSTSSEANYYESTLFAAKADTQNILIQQEQG